MTASPPEIASISLLDEIAQGGFQASVITSFCCYFPFYEDVVLRRLIDKGCTNNVLLVDAKQCARALVSEDGRPRRAGRDYTLFPIDVSGAFHPKLAVLLGKSKGALFVGSHNATVAGFGLNDEVTNAFRTSGAGSRHGAGVIRSALDYARSFVPETLPEFLQAFNSVHRNIPWLNGPYSVESDERQLLTTTGRDVDLWSRMRLLIPKRPSVALVCGPFFDSELRFLERIRDDVDPQRLVVGIDPNSVEISPAAVKQFKGAEFVNVGGLAQVPNRRESSATYLHAKILWFKGAQGEVLVTGSANPSSPAFAPESGFRNAEAVVVDRRPGSGHQLGLDAFISAMPITGADWVGIEERRAREAEASADLVSMVVLAIPADDGFRLERPLNEPVVLEGLLADGTMIGTAIPRPSEPSFLDASADVVDTAHLLRGVTEANRTLTVLIHRPEEIARHTGGDRQRQLRQALGAFDEDPTQIETLLKLTHRAIFESDDIVATEPQLRPKAERPEAEKTSTGPESLAIDAAGRHVSRKKKQLASGDVLVLLDALMRRLGEGLDLSGAPRAIPDEERPVTDGGEGDEKPPAPPPPYELLADACRAKVGNLARRMIKQLEAPKTGNARRAIVQLAAVVSVVQTLRVMEQRTEWRSKHLRLVDPKHERMLFEASSLALGWDSSSLAPRALAEGDGDSFQELFIASGLLAWLAWDTELDVQAVLRRTASVDLAKEEPPWLGLQLFAIVGSLIADDAEAQETLKTAVTRTARKGTDVSSWLATHIGYAQRLAVLRRTPERFRNPSRPPRAGDLMVLGPTLDPRIRVALEVEPSSATLKVTVLDPAYPKGERQFLASHCQVVDWDSLTGSSDVASA